MNTKTSAYVCTLPETTQLSIIATLKSKGISQLDIERAMNSRLCDLSDALDSEEIH